MPTMIEVRPASKPALLMGRIVSSLAIQFLLFDGMAKLVPWPVVTDTLRKMGYRSSETLARSLGIITIACRMLYSVPPTSILGAILLTGYLGGAASSHVRIDSSLFTHTLLAVYPCLIAWGCLWLRESRLDGTLSFRR
jgi:hypothetical protein